MDKYRPESRQEKKARLRERAEQRAKGRADEPGKKKAVVRSGISSVTSLVEQKKATLVVIAHDVDPIEVSLCSKCSSLYNKLLYYDEIWIPLPKHWYLCGCNLLSDTK